MSKKQDKELLEKAKERFKSCMDYYRAEYNRGQDDVEFLMGSQWDEKIQNKRKIEGRPCLTENRLLPFAHQVINDIRQSRPAISVVPVDGNADVETAKIMRGMIRNIEVQSSADNVYDTAAWNAISAGYGWTRINTKFTGNDTFDQEIELIRIPDFSTVMIDTSAKSMDGSDAEYGFVFEDVSHETFEEMFPDADPVSFRDDGNEGFCDEETVRICEYFYKEYETKTIVLTPDGVMDLDQAEKNGIEIIQEREVRTPVVKWCKFTAEEILDKTDWLGQYIPLVPTYGEEIWQDNRRKCFSLIHQARSPQERYNYWLTASTEIVALQPKAPFIGLTGQFASAGNRWARANNETFAYLEFDPVELPDGQIYAAPPQRQQPPTGSPAMFQEMMAAADGVKASLGMFNASLGQQGNETSGKAILARQREGDNATFHFVDNLQSSIRQIGRILVDLIPKVYDKPRIVRIIGEDDAKLSVPINQAAVKAKNGYAPLSENQKPDAFFDMLAGKYDVVVSVGQSYATKRQETANILQAILQAAPETFNLFGDIFLKNLDIAEADIMVERMRRLNPIMQDDSDPQQAQLAQAQQQLQAMQIQLAQMDEALKQKRNKEQAEAEVEIQKTMAEVEKIKAETVKIQTEVAAAATQMNGVTPEVLDEIVRTIANLEHQTKDTADAIEIILGAAETAQQPIPEQSGNPVSLPPEAMAMLNEQGNTNGTSTGE
jgi:hypothetical protein